MKTSPAIVLVGTLAFVLGVVVSEFALPHAANWKSHSDDAPMAADSTPDGNQALDRQPLFGPGHLPTDVPGLLEAFSALLPQGDNFNYNGQLYLLTRQMTAANARAIIKGVIESRKLGDWSYYVLPHLFGRWMELDPTKAMAALKDIPDGEERASATSAALESWAGTDFDAASRWVEAQPAGEAKNRAQQTLLESLATADPQRALGLAIRDARPGGSTGLIQTIFSALASRGPSAAADEAVNLPPGPMRTAALDGVASQWVALDPQAAIAFIGAQLSGDRRVELTSQALRSWQRKDPDAVFTWLQNQPPGVERRDLVGSLIQEFSRDDPTDAIRLADLAPPSAQDHMLEDIGGSWATQAPVEAEAWAKSQTDPAVSTSIWRGIIKGVQTVHPQEAAALISQLPKDQQSESVGEVSSSWAEEDPSSAIAWASGLPDHGLQMTATKAVLGTWLGKDQSAALQWFSKMPARADRDDVLANFADSLVGTDPVAAVKWVDTIQDPDQRARSTTRTLEIWLSADREGAAAWIVNSNLPDETKKKLLTPGH